MIADDCDNCGERPADPLLTGEDGTEWCAPCAVVSLDAENERLSGEVTRLRSALEALLVEVTDERGELCRYEDGLTIVSRPAFRRAREALR